MEPSQLPTKYWAESATVTTRTHLTSLELPSTGSGKKSGHSHTAEVMPSPPKLDCSVQWMRSGEE